MTRIALRLLSSPVLARFLERMRPPTQRHQGGPLRRYSIGALSPVGEIAETVVCDRGVESVVKPMEGHMAAKYSAALIASWFVAWAEAEDAEVSNLKLQKLLYFAQGHHLGGSS